LLFFATDFWIWPFYFVPCVWSLAERKDLSELEQASNFKMAWAHSMTFMPMAGLLSLELSAFWKSRARYGWLWEDFCTRIRCSPTLNVPSSCWRQWVKQSIYPRHCLLWSRHESFIIFASSRLATLLIDARSIMQTLTFLKALPVVSAQSPAESAEYVVNRFIRWFKQINTFEPYQKAFQSAFKFNLIWDTAVLQ
jgi:hypothetical protein